MTTRTPSKKMGIHKRMLPFVSVVCFLVYLSACSTTKNYKILSFFFDGVPHPVNETPVLKADTVSSLASVDLTQETVQNVTPKIQPHPPYHDRQCGSCHDQSTMGKLLKPLPELCYQCHNNFGTKYKVLHGPIGGGQCNMCHSPHMSANPNLLTRTEQQLCLYCHDSRQVMNNTHHAEIKDIDCIVCHNPHGGNDRNLLR
jgi:predicted CXXCH cytochrome family protein